MLSVKNINNVITRLGLEDFSVENVVVDTYGDIISVFDPDFDSERAIRKILQNVVLLKKVSESDKRHVEYEDVVWDNGNKVKVGVIVCRGEMGFGTSIKIMVKSLCVVVDGEQKNFLGFEAYDNYVRLTSKH